jgi:hypothetical protein
VAEVQAKHVHACTGQGLHLVEAAACGAQGGDDARATGSNHEARFLRFNAADKTTGRRGKQDKAGR